MKVTTGTFWILISCELTHQTTHIIKLTLTVPRQRRHGPGKLQLLLVEPSASGQLSQIYGQRLQRVHDRSRWCLVVQRSCSDVGVQ